MKNISLLFIAFLLFQITSLAQAPDTLWTKTFGGVTQDRGYCVQQTEDGGFIITGQTNYDVWLIKTNASGDTIWTKTIVLFGGQGGRSVQQTSDGGYFVTGYTITQGIYEDALLIKTDALGDTLWTKTFGGIVYDMAYCGQQTSDGGYITTGYMWGNDFDLWLIKMDASGSTVWTKTLGGTEQVKDVGRFVQQTSDGGYIIVGYTQSYGAGQSDVWLIKTDAFGDTLWTKTFGGTNYDEGYSSQQTTDDGYIIAGMTMSYGDGWGDVWLIKTNSTGDTLWTKTFGEINKTDKGYSVQQVADGGYIITGITSSYGAGLTDLWIIKTDASGNKVWTKTFGGSDNDEGYFVRQTTDGGYIITGVTKSFGAGENDLWLIKTAPDTGMTSIENYRILHPSYFSLYQNFPNPFNPQTIINYKVAELSYVTLKVYDVLGNEITTLVNKEKPIGSYSVEFNATALPSGIYFYRLQAGDYTETKKMVLMK